MGFGTLFIGYFLLLNLTYFSASDIIAAAIMLLGLYKLSFVNKKFKATMMVTALFLLFSFAEFGIWAYEMFFIKIDSTVLMSVLTVTRSLIIGAITVLLLMSIKEIAGEVELADIPKKCDKLMIASSVIYFLWIISEIPMPFISEYVLAVMAVITVISTIAVLIVNLTVIYTCYMKICMPGDENIMVTKPSRFGFVNEYRKRKAERDAETQRERLELLKQRQERKGKKK